METQGVLPLNSTQHALTRGGLQEIQDSPLRVEEVGLFQIANRIIRERC